MSWHHARFERHIMRWHLGRLHVDSCRVDRLYRLLTSELWGCWPCGHVTTRSWHPIGWELRSRLACSCCDRWASMWSVLSHHGGSTASHHMTHIMQSTLQIRQINITLMVSKNNKVSLLWSLSHKHFKFKSRSQVQYETKCLMTYR